ncbi:hypothetical protein Bbelb_321330 [Branchiostoma belcheri]|nr:hypothetical protein Bbelb_321330 [Branchiostoma belcheri]
MSAAPVIDFSANGFWGGVTLKITDPRIAAGVVAGASAVGLALALRHRTAQTAEEAPRRDGGELQPDPEVVAIEEGSLYVRVGFRTEDGYDFFSALYDQEYIQTRLKAEFKTLGFQGELKVILKRSQRFHPTTPLTESESGIETASVSAQSGVSSEDVPEGPLNRLQPYRDSPTGQRLIQACRTMERGAELLTSSGYTDPAGLTLLAEGSIMWGLVSSGGFNYFLYDPGCLQLDKKRLNHLTSTQLEHSPAGSSCLFLQAALLPEGDSRVERLRQIVNTILQNGEEDPLHPYLHHISCMLAFSIDIATDQPGPALAAFATALMYKSDHPLTLFYTALCSMKVSTSDAIQQFHQYRRVVPPCDTYVPHAHYRLTALYGEQQPVDREKVETHYRRGQEAEKNSLPVFGVPEWIKDDAKKAYDRATSTNILNSPLFRTFELPDHVITTGISPAATIHLSCTKAAPVIDFSVTGHWGGVTLKITDSRIAAGVVAGASAVGLVLALSRFYRDNRDDVDDIIRRVIERLKRRPRRDGGEPQPDPEVVAIEEGSLYVHVGFRTEDGYDFFSALYDQEYIQTRLKAEFKTLGFQGELKVILERSQSFRPTTLLTKSESGIETASVSAQSGVSSEDVPEGPLERYRLALQPYLDSAIAQREIQGCRIAERGAELLTGSGYTDPAGLTLLAEGIIMWGLFNSENCNYFLYDPDCLQLDKKRLNHLTSTQLEHSTTDSSCLFLQAALLPWGHSRVARLRQTVNTILQNGEEDPLHPYLHHISCMLAESIQMATGQPGPALAAFATALMYKSDHPRTLVCTAWCSMKVSTSDAIQQFHQYLRVAPPCDVYVPDAHYNLTVLYGEQQPVDREKVETHYRRGQETEKNMLPVFFVPGWIKDAAKKAYDRATRGTKM